MSNTLTPTFENREAFTVAGLLLHGADEPAELKGLWNRLGERFDALQPLAVSGAAYGVIDNFDEEKGVFDYMAGVQVATPQALPQGFELWHLPAQYYAVFPTTLETLHDTIDQIYTQWLPHSNYERAPGPEFEYYDADFDANSPSAPFYLYIPIQPAAGGE